MVGECWRAKCQLPSLHLIQLIHIRFVQRLQFFLCFSFDEILFLFARDDDYDDGILIEKVRFVLVESLSLFRYME